MQMVHVWIEMTQRVYKGCLLFIVVKIQWYNLVVWVES